jgi:hypothetical protein
LIIVSYVEPLHVIPSHIEAQMFGSSRVWNCRLHMAALVCVQGSCGVATRRPIAMRLIDQKCREAANPGISRFDEWLLLLPRRCRLSWTAGGRSGLAWHAHHISGTNPQEIVAISSHQYTRMARALHEHEQKRVSIFQVA